MPLYFLKENILKIPADIIVNPSDGVDFNEDSISKLIASSAGQKYIEAVDKFESLALGNVFISEAFELDNKYIAHVALPTWRGGTHNEREYIDSCYSEVLYETDELQSSSVVFPVLGIGVHGIPYEETLDIGFKAIRNYLAVKDNLRVFIAVSDDKIFEYIQSEYRDYCISSEQIEKTISQQTLDYKIEHLDCSFIELLEKYMNRMGLNAVQCYSAAGVDKKLFSKIKNTKNYKPGKNTIIKFAFALHLSLDETQQLLGTCGYILSKSIIEDIVIMYYLSQRKYCLEEAYKEIEERSH